MINDSFRSIEWMATLKSHYESYKDYHDSDTSLGCAPFRLITLANFLSNDKIRSVTDQVKTLSFNHKSNDLYEFYQSNELKYTKEGVIAELAQFLSGTYWISTMANITGTQLSGDLDMAAQEYRQGGYLLCHDDDMGQDEDARLIAFILYLNDPDWNEEDGGQLQLYDTDEKGQPGKIVRSILPKSNTFAFFSLSRTSYHQVQEVFSTRFNRYSITGWFRGTRKISIPFLEYKLLKSDSRMEWINPVYLNSSNVFMLKNAFCNQSYLVLRDFIVPEIFKNLLNASIKYTQVGPPNVQSFSKLCTCDDIWKEFLFWIQSKELQAFIESITGLELSRLDNLCVRKFSNGDYSLIHDQIIEPLGLDMIMSFPAFASNSNHEWDDTWGGLMHYIYDKDSIFTHKPQLNELVLVYRNDADIHRFVKYMTKTSLGHRMELIGTYLEE